MIFAALGKQAEAERERLGRRSLTAEGDVFGVGRSCAMGVAGVFRSKPAVFIYAIYRRFFGDWWSENKTTEFFFSGCRWIAGVVSINLMNSGA